MPDGSHHDLMGVIADAGDTYEYQYRIVSIKHFDELQETINQLRQQDRLSHSETFQGYLSEMKFAVPDDFPTAKSVVVIAIFSRAMAVNLHFDGAPVTAIMPPNYYDNGLSREAIKEAVLTRIIPESGYRAERMGHRYHLKLLAVRSGLGRYGRNNICYVDGMGSFITLHAYLTDYPFEVDHWSELKMMDLCQSCRICMKQCPGGAIREEDFVVDINHCIPLYNEVPGVLPEWIPSTAHNAIFGCMKCQAPCPANREAMQHNGQFEDLTAEEIRQFLAGSPEPDIVRSVDRKLHLNYLTEYPEMVEVVSRNLRVLQPNK